MAKRPLRFGEPIAHLHVKSNRNPRFATGSLGGRYVLLCVASDLTRADVRTALETLKAAGVQEGMRLAAVLTASAEAESDTLLKELAETTLVFFDEDGAAAETWGLPEPQWALFDPSSRALAFWPIDQSAQALAALANAPPTNAHAGVPLHAPVLIVPRVFEPAFCKTLIAAYDANGGMDSGTTKESPDGKTYVSLDHAFKRRSDYVIEEKPLRDAAMHRIFWRLLPEIEKAFMFKVTRMERYIVACYDAQSGGFFKPHRDNTTKGTAHRRFAVTINLNAEDYDGGDLRFPEFGDRTYRAPTGGAVVFSCSLLHEATAVTRGKRYAFLPFLYDEAAAKVRAENNAYLDDSIGQYAT